MSTPHLRTLSMRVSSLCTLGLALLAGCDDPAGARGRSEENWKLSVEAVQQAALPGVRQTQPVRFRVVDEQGEPVSGAALSFSMSPSGRVEPLDSPFTDPDGHVSVLLTPGTKSGRYTVRGSIQGKSPEASYSFVASMLSLEADSIVMAAPSCSKTIFARTVEDHSNGGQAPINFVVGDSSIVRLTYPTYRGTPYLQARHFTPLAPGQTRVIAQYKDWADTAVIRVFDDRDLVPLRIDLPPRWVAAPIGEGARIPEVWAGVYGRGDCRIPSAHATFSIADTSIARIGSQAYSRATILGRTPGDTRLEARYAGVSASTRVVARRIKIVPADTTIRVGESFSYRMFLAGPDGVFSELPVSGVHAGGAAVSRSATTNVVTGVAPGVARMNVWSGEWEVISGPVVRVVSP